MYVQHTDIRRAGPMYVKHADIRRAGPMYVQHTDIRRTMYGAARLYNNFASRYRAFTGCSLVSVTL